MNNYIMGSTIKRLREANKMTQMELANKLMVSDKTISKWENMRGLPDITMIEPLAKSLHVSIIELMNGDNIVNKNKATNMLKSKLYVCPVCGNIIHTTGDVLVSCCGVTLPVLEVEEANYQHEISCVCSEHEYYVTLNHEMTKQHYISFIGYVTGDRFEIKKLYGQGSCEARFFMRGHGIIYAYCNIHGLMSLKV